MQKFVVCQFNQDTESLSPCNWYHLVREECKDKPQNPVMGNFGVRIWKRLPSGETEYWDGGIPTSFYT